MWGWDPKDYTNHYGYQGSHVGYPFTSNSGADCIVWLTGEEAFLECVKTCLSVRRELVLDSGALESGWYSQSAALTVY